MLKRDQKVNLLEMLLIVGSIIAAFQLPSSMIWMFMFFAFMAILYYISLQAGENLRTTYMKSVSILTSASFVGVLSFQFGVSVINTFPNYVIPFLILTFIYYVVFTGIIYEALTKEK